MTHIVGVIGVSATAAATVVVPAAAAIVVSVTAEAGYRVESIVPVVVSAAATVAVPTAATAVVSAAAAVSRLHCAELIDKNERTVIAAPAAAQRSEQIGESGKKRIIAVIAVAAGVSAAARIAGITHSFTSIVKILNGDFRTISVCSRLHFAFAPTARPCCADKFFRQRLAILPAF